MFGVFCVYAPPNPKPTPEKLQFYSTLDDEYRRCNANAGKIIFGDLNARMGHQCMGEDHILGKHGWGRRAVAQVDTPNRDLLMEFCGGLDLVVANSFFNAPLEEKVTYMEPGATFNGQINELQYNILDLLLCNSSVFAQVKDLRSHRQIPLATDHYLVTCTLAHPPGEVRQKSHQHACREALRDQSVRLHYAETFMEIFEDFPTIPKTIESMWRQGEQAALAATSVFPQMPAERKQPWISQNTLELIDKRTQARLANNTEEEKRLLKEVRKSCKQDKTSWVENNIANGCWDAIRAHCRARPRKQGRLQNLEGELVESSGRADTMAEFLEQVQWRVRPTDFLGPTLPVSEAAFTVQKVGQVMRKLKWNKAAGSDGVPA